MKFFEGKRLKYGQTRMVKKFAFLPKKINTCPDTYVWVWLEYYISNQMVDTPLDFGHGRKFYWFEKSRSIIDE